jgi:membrane protein DedA with SNARE-associated domain
MSETGKAARSRKLAIVTAALTAVLGSVPAFTMTHGHRLLGFVTIGVQVVLLVLAIHYLVQYRRQSAAERD